MALFCGLAFALFCAHLRVSVKTAFRTTAFGTPEIMRLHSQGDVPFVSSRQFKPHEQTVNIQVEHIPIYIVVPLLLLRIEGRETLQHTSHGIAPPICTAGQYF